MGPELNEGYRLFAGAAERKNSPMRSHDEKLRVTAFVAKPLFEASDISSRAWSHIGIGNRRRCSFVLEPLPGMFDSRRDINSRQSLSHEISSCNFVRRVNVRIQKGDSDCFCAISL